MQFTIRKKPVKVASSGATGLLVGLAVATLLPLSLDIYFIALFATGSTLVFIAIISFLVPFFGGVDVGDGRIETATELGGLITIRIEDIDLERSTLSSLGLKIVPVVGEAIFVSASEYSRDDIRKVAHYLGMSGSGWSQHV